MRSRRTGKLIKTVLQRFIDGIKVTKNGCWEWQGSKNRGGYGTIGVVTRDGNKNMLAHRYFYEQYTGIKIPDGLQVCHKCDNPSCVYPKHLFLGTSQDNVNDMITKGRTNIDNRRGSLNYRAKLTESDVLEIRRDYIPLINTCTHLGKKYGVTRETIHAVLMRTTWKHI